VVTKVRQRELISEQATQKFDKERFNLKKLNDVEVGEEYQIKNSNRFAAFQNFGDDVVDIHMAWESTRLLSTMPCSRI
jgi:hypothetical protein